MILAAAVKYKIEATGKEVVLCGARHANVFAQLEALGFQPRQGYTEIAQGFIDHKNRFLTREEAWEHAKEIGQVCEGVIHERETECLLFGKRLVSEDLW